jgi:hypothetical protein
VRLRETVLALLLAGLSCGCWPFATGPLHTSLADVARGGDALALSDALEALIAEGKDTPADREFALNTVRAHELPTTEYAFARAAITGRVVQTRGLTGAGLVADVEKWALASRKLDPNFRGGAAARMLGTLYVMAPAGWLEHGDSEQGLELLEGLVKAHPETLENQLRLAEAYISLGDPAPATPYLCRCRARRGDLRRDDQQLLDHLFADASNPACPTPAAPRALTPAAAPTPAPAPAPTPAHAPAPAPPPPPAPAP